MTLYSIMNEEQMQNDKLLESFEVSTVLTENDISSNTNNRTIAIGINDFVNADLNNAHPYANRPKTSKIADMLYLKFSDGSFSYTMMAVLVSTVIVMFWIMLGNLLAIMVNFTCVEAPIYSCSNFSILVDLMSIVSLTSVYIYFDSKGFDKVKTIMILSMAIFIMQVIIEAHKFTEDVSVFNAIYRLRSQTGKFTL